MNGETATREYATPVTKLVLYEKSNRMPHSSRDLGACAGLLFMYPCGGDGWARPSVKELAEHYHGTLWGDFSNMNGGKFPPHSSHDTGWDIDGWFPGFNPKSGRAAKRIVAALNDKRYGAMIQCAFVSYRRGNAFQKAIAGLMLDDGRRAADVIRMEKQHDTHFHFRISQRRTKACSLAPRVP